MAIIKGALFKGRTIYATQPSATRIRDTDLSFLAPFIQRVTFIPTECDVDLLFNEFCLVRTLLGGNTATDEEMTAEFTTRQRLARRGDIIFKSGELVRVWTALFPQLKVVKDIDVPELIGDHPLLLDSPYHDLLFPDSQYEDQVAHRPASGVPLTLALSERCCDMPGKDTLIYY